MASNVAASAASAPDPLVTFDIPSQRADLALTAFADQANVTLVFPFDLASRTTANRLVGTYEVAEGLQRLLEGTPLRGFGKPGALRVVGRSDNEGAGTTMKIDKRRAGALGVLLGFFTNGAYGQAAPAASATAGGSAPLEEITVTARKREETLTSVPVAVTAFTAERLEAVGVASLEELSRFSPGLSVQNQGGSAGGRLLSGIRFRGMNPTILTPSTQVGALFVDGIYFLGGAQSIGFEDVERVEVIRGPQAAYFGRSTFGGAINYITRDPGTEFGGRVAAEAASFGTHAFSLSLDGPLAGDWMAGRLTASRREKGAQFTASDGGDLGRERTDTLAGTLLLTPTDALRIKLRASYSEDDDSAPTMSTVSYTRFVNCPPGTPVRYRNGSGAVVNGALTLNSICGALPFDGVAITSNTTFRNPFPPALTAPVAGGTPVPIAIDPRAVLVGNSFNSRRLADAPPLDRIGLTRRIARYAGTFDWSISDALTLSGSLAYNEQAGLALRDGDFSDLETIYVGAPFRFEDRSAELRLSYDGSGAWRTMLGANYYEQDLQEGFANGIETTYGFRIPATGPLTRPNPLQNSNRDDKIETRGIFGSIEYDFLDAFTVTLEGRYQVDQVGRFSGSQLAGIRREPDYESKKFLPRAILSWRPLPGTTVYAQYAKGTLPGDNTNRAVFQTLTAAQRAEVLQATGGGVAEEIESEVLDSYELGVKQELLDGRLRYALVGYYMEWQNQKANTSIFIVADNGRTVTFRVPGDSEIKGVEFETDWAATEQLRFAATLNWTDSKYTDFKVASNAALFGGTALAGWNAAGNRQPRFPELSGTLSATFTDRLNDDWEYFLRGDLLYTGRQYVDETNLSYLDPYSTLNVGVGLTRDRFSVQLFANNLLDEDAWAAASNNADLTLSQVITLPVQRSASATPIDRRTIGVRTSYRF
jgi:iron complex outermembrane receptor protein